MSILKTIYRKTLRILPTKLALYIIYFRGYHKILNLKDPKTFGEKIQWLKLYGNLNELSQYVDKYEVRKFVSDTIGEEYLNELYGVYNSPEEIDYDKLPNKFVLKSTNGSGAVLICEDKNSFDFDSANKTMKKWLKDDYWKEKKEPQYKGIKNKIIIEKFMEDKHGLTDYKFYCFDGEPLYYGIFYDRYTNKSIDIYDKDDKKLEGVNCCHIQNSNFVETDKEKFDKMKELSRKLSSIFTFVRVDFYYVDGNPVFGELTFTDGAGSDPWYPEKFDLEIADKIKLTSVLKK